jgi:hypothetical protein
MSRNASPNRARNETELAAVMDRIATLRRQGVGPRASARRLGTSAGVVSGLLARARRRTNERFKPTPPRPRMQSEKMTAPVVKPIVAAKPQPLPSLPSKVADAEVADALPLAKLQPGQCHWPVNAPERGEVFLYCSAPVAKPRAVYCEAHMSVRPLSWP